MHSTEALIDRQLRKWEMERSLQRSAKERAEPVPAPQGVITVSRQRGSGGTLLAERLATRFGYTLLHRDLIDRICESTGYKRRLLESLDEHSRNEISVWLESILAGRYLNATDYVRALFETISSVARLGGVVVVGRGANFVIGPKHGFHLRVVAPREVRIQNLVEREGLSEKAAAHEVDVADRERAEFMRKVYGHSIDDPLHYDLVINHLSISVDSAVSLIAAAALEKFDRMRATQEARA
jgi:cytidylate kinase